MRGHDNREALRAFAPVAGTSHCGGIYRMLTISRALRWDLRASGLSSL